MQAEHARLLAAEQERATRLEEERREQERQKQLAREREQQRRENHQKLIRMTSPESLRSLRELIRRKYELDMSIWADRKVRAPLRPDVEVKMEQADAALAEILAIVGTWEDNRNGQWKEHEWRLASEVKMRLEADGKRIWAGNPPWEEG
jgi:phage protein D